VEDTTVQAQVENGQEESGSSLPLPLVGAALLIVIGGVLYWRSRADEEEEEKEE
jgi:cobalamin biosynthesis Mg chelatase CobN